MLGLFLQEMDQEELHLSVFCQPSEIVFCQISIKTNNRFSFLCLFVFTGLQEGWSGGIYTVIDCFCNNYGYFKGKSDDSGYQFQIMDNDDDNADICDESFESVKEELILESSIDSDAEVPKAHFGVHFCLLNYNL